MMILLIIIKRKKIIKKFIPILVRINYPLGSLKIYDEMIIFIFLFYITKKNYYVKKKIRSVNIKNVCIIININ